MQTFIPLAIRNYCKRAVLLGAVALLWNPLNASAQSSKIVQSFGTNPTGDANYNFTPTLVTGVSGVVTGPFGTDGASPSFPGPGAYGIRNDNNGNSTYSVALDFDEKTFREGSGTASSPNRLSFDVASLNFGTGSVRGFNNAARLEVFLDVNKAGFTSALVITRTPTQNQNGFIFDFGSPVATTRTYSPTSTASIQIGSNTPLSVAINLPSSATSLTSVAVRFVISTTDRSLLLIDNVALSSGNSATPLPVELTRFEGAAKQQGVSLNWATATEKNNDRFEVQRSADGQSFQTIGSVKGHGNSSSAREYSFADSRPLAGQSYYRLRQVDTDGTSAFSPVVAVQTSTEVAVFPNPTADAVVLPATLGFVQYRVLNALGQTLLRGKAAGNDRLDLTSLNKGTYFLELTGAAESTMQRVVRE